MWEVPKLVRITTRRRLCHEELDVVFVRQRPTGCEDALVARFPGQLRLEKRNRVLGGDATTVCASLTSHYRN
jgi:hypothetical protein